MPSTNWPAEYDPSNKQFRINLSAAQTLYGEKLLTLKDSAGAANMLRKALTSAADNGQAGKLLESKPPQKWVLIPILPTIDWA